LVESIVTIAGGRAVDRLAEAVAHFIVGVAGLVDRRARTARCPGRGGCAGCNCRAGDGGDRQRDEGVCSRTTTRLSYSDDIPGSLFVLYN
jgi:hypothetical protein